MAVADAPSSRGGSLPERAAEALEGGPLEPAELARRVMGLTGPAAQAASVVRTLLASDSRFRQEEDGRWSLTRLEAPASVHLRDLRFAVVDLETTGSAFRLGHRVTEVAVVSVEGGVVEDSFESLVNPGRSIPPRVRALTGITDEMVAGAPYFDMLADEVAERLRGRIFVAHNVGFDWRFLREELAQATGDVPETTALCTVRLARSLLPDLGRYRLDSVAGHFGIPIVGRHRAYGDALATARILIRLLDEAALSGIADLDGLQRLVGSGLVREGGRPG